MNTMFNKMESFLKVTRHPEHSSEHTKWHLQTLAPVAGEGGYPYMSYMGIVRHQRLGFLRGFGLKLAFLDKTMETNWCLTKNILDTALKTGNSLSLKSEIG